MIHQPSGGFQGQAADIEIHAREIIRTRERLNQIYVKHSGRSMDEIEKGMERDNFMTGEEAKAFGLIDEVIEKRSEEHTSELQSLMRISYAVFCLKKKKNNIKYKNYKHTTD